MAETTRGTDHPVLHFRGCSEAGLDLHALLFRPGTTPPEEIRLADRAVAPVLLDRIGGLSAWRYELRLPPGSAGYRFEGRDYPVVTDVAGDLRLAFVSCNGEEHGDLDRDEPERNAMWARLAAEHRRAPVALLLQGGDQIYADEVTDGHPLSDGWPDDLPAAPRAEELEDLRRHLERGFVDRYMRLLAAPTCAEVLSRIPTLAIWDDHDICDGWGSLSRRVSETAVAGVLFAVARRMYLLFQQGMVEADVARLLPDATGESLGWRHDLPGLCLLGPDLRSERQRRRVMGPKGWQMVETTDPAPGTRSIVISSVPLLGPRLSLVEKFLLMIPRMQKYEDDLRDQWQSHAHREEWVRMLREMRRLRAKGPVTVISGEIHLATRAEMRAPEGTVHQLVASGIAHRAPSGGYATGLGLLARFGEAPIPGSPIRILPLPGKRRAYVAERNFLILDRSGGDWTAIWHLEESGPTPAMAI